MKREAVLANAQLARDQALQGPQAQEPGAQ